MSACFMWRQLARASPAGWGWGPWGSVTKKNGEQTNLHQTGLGYLLSAGQMILTGELADRLRSLKGDCPHITLLPLPGVTQADYRPREDAGPLGPALRFSGKVARDWWISSYSSMLGWRPHADAKAVGSGQGASGCG